MVPAELVRQDLLAHAIQTVVFASLRVVADHNHLCHHSLVLEQVEAHAVKVADAGAIAHARYFLFSTLSPPIAVMELEAILPLYQAVLESC